MDKKTIDLHSFKLEDAINQLYQLIDDVRMTGGSLYVIFITGHGIIKEKYKEIIINEDLYCKETFGNAGIIEAIIE